jgi:hypothetical protein
MGVEDTSYNIPDLNANTTFHSWVVKENDEIIEKLNLLNIYNLVGSTGIDVVAATGGTATISMSDTISGITVSGDLVVTGNITGCPVISVNGLTGAVTIALTGDTGERGITGAVGTGPHEFTIKNQLTNGNFDVWQRGTSFTSKVSSHLADRWCFNTSRPAAYGGGGKKNVTQVAFSKGQTEVPGNPTYYLNLDLTFGTLFAPDFHALENKIEGQTKFVGETVTIDGYVRLNIGTGVTLTPYIKRSIADGTSYTIEEFSTPIIGTSSNWTYFNVNHLSSGGTHAGATGDGYVAIGFKTNTGTSATSANWDFSNIRVFSSQGGTLSAAPYFEETDPKVELQKCSRYYQRTYDLDVTTGSATMISSQEPDFTPVQFTASPNQERIHLPFDVEMRTTPTVSVYSPESGTITDPYNRSALVDMRLSSGSTGYGGTRIHTTGSDTLSVTPNIKGISVLPLSGYVIFDEICLHYVADSEYTV